MDFKGITWVGNVYQKFEAMCLEVEEVVYEDTVKYVEGQMQKVSGSVKKFYSEIMDDLLPSSGYVPAKFGDSDLVLDPYGHVHIMKKPSDNYGQLKKKEVENMFDFAEEKQVKKHVLVEDVPSDVCATTQSKKLGACRRPIGIKRISKTSSLSTTLCSPISSSPVRRCNPEDTVDNIASGKVTLTETVRPEKDDSECSPVSENRRCNPADAIESIAPAKATSTETVRPEKDVSECSPVETIQSTGTPIKKKADSEFLASSSPGEEHIIPQVESKRTMNEEDKPKTDERNSNILINTRSSEPAGREMRRPYEDDFEMELIEKVEEAETESCIMVEAEDAPEFCGASQGTMKSKPYKKKIGEALAAKLGHKKKKKKQQESCLLESDWELL